MMTPAYTDFTGLAGIVVALAAAPLAIPGARRMRRSRLAALLATVAVLVLIPFNPLSVAACVRGGSGDLSITTLILLGSAILRALTGWATADRDARFGLLAFISVAALALYPLALGLGMFDPYRLGYGALALVGALSAVALAAWYGRRHLIAICLALAMLAWTVRWYESTNLWDYLLDPLVSFYALGCVVGRGVRRLANYRRGTTPAGSARQP
jgi:hypothetical protein